MKQSTLLMLSFLTPSLCTGIACDNASSPSQPWLRTPVEDADSTETLAQSLYVNYANLQEAYEDTARRKRDLLYAIVWNYWEMRLDAKTDPSTFLPNEGLPPWTSGKCNDDQKIDARQAIAWMAALLKVLADPRPYQDAGGQYSRYPVVGLLIDEQGDEYQAFLHYRDLVARYLAEIKPIGNPGNNAQLWDYEAKDYDMVLLPLVGMLYGLRETKFYDHENLGLTSDESFAITNQMAYDILCQQSKHCLDEGRAYYSFSDGREHLTATPKPAYYIPETENHVLILLAWNFLATQWVMWQGSLPPSDERFHLPFKDMVDTNQHLWNEIREPMQTLLLQVLGRPVHRGFFEVNARPYEVFSAQAIFSLAEHSDLLLDPRLPDHLYLGKIRQAAENALMYLATRLAFQSDRGKRMSPMRRQEGYRRSLNLYGSDTDTFFALLTGSYEYDDCFQDEEDCRFNYLGSFANLGTRLLPVVLGTYTLPAIIQQYFRLLSRICG